jgi:hypothetical protein
MATMAAAAEVLQTSGAYLQQQQQQRLRLAAAAGSDSSSSSGAMQAGQGVAQSSSPAAAAAAAAASGDAGVLAAAGLADMVCLTGDELADLLGPEDDTCRMLLQQLHTQQQQQQETHIEQQQVLQLAAGAFGRVPEMLSKLRGQGQPALLELEAGHGTAQQQQQYSSLLDAALEHLLSSPTATSAASVAADAADGSAATLATAAGDTGGRSSSSRRSGKACPRQDLVELLQGLTQDVGTQQGALRTALLVTVSACYS